jgi:hypothetical protein
VDDFLALTRTVISAAWIYMCVLAAVALWLLLFDRARRPPRGGDGPPRSPANVEGRIGMAPRSADALALGRLPDDVGSPYAGAQKLHDPGLHHDARSPAVTAVTGSSTGRLK